MNKLVILLFGLLVSSLSLNTWQGLELSKGKECKTITVKRSAIKFAPIWSSKLRRVSYVKIK